MSSHPAAEQTLPRSATLFDSVGRFAFRYRDYLIPAGFVLALIFAEPQAPFGSERADLMMDIVGILVAAAGQALRVTVIGYAYIKRGGSGKKLSAPRLVVEGFYGHCRNPMYAGNVLLLTGLALIYNSLVVYAVLLPLSFVGILSIIKAEERFLAERLGAGYADYCRRVPRFVPNLRGIKQTVAGLRFDWLRVLRKEYGTTFAWLSGALALMAWERIVRLDWAEAAPQLQTLALIYLPLPFLWRFVSFLKHRKRLDSPEHMTKR